MTPNETREALIETVRAGHAARVAAETAECEEPLERRAMWGGSAIYFYLARPGTSRGRRYGRNVERSVAVLHLTRKDRGRLPRHEHKLLMARWVRTGRLPEGAEPVDEI